MNRCRDCLVSLTGWPRPRGVQLVFEAVGLSGCDRLHPPDSDLDLSEELRYPFPVSSSTREPRREPRREPCSWISGTTLDKPHATRNPWHNCLWYALLVWVPRASLRWNLGAWLARCKSLEARLGRLDPNVPDSCATGYTTYVMSVAKLSRDPCSSHSSLLLELPGSNCIWTAPILVQHRHPYSYWQDQPCLDTRMWHPIIAALPIFRKRMLDPAWKSLLLFDPFTCRLK